MTREELIEGVRAVEQSLFSAEDCDKQVFALAAAVPHSFISDLIFYPERERSHEEIVDEALLREKLWAQGGDSAVRARIQAQMRATLADTTVPENHHTKFSARQLLETSSS